VAQTQSPSSVAENENMNPTKEDFAALLEDSFAANNTQEGSVIKGRITAIENDLAIIDVGLKTEGRVPLREFATAGQKADIAVGDEVEVYLERIENAMGEAVLSRDKAQREESWTSLEKSFAANERIEGIILGRVKGGFTVDLNGATAFLPGSQVDIRPVHDIAPLMNTSQTFRILKMDRRRGNIVISRRAIIEENRVEERTETIRNLTEGQIVEGVVKNITEYGAFVDLGGIDGLLHVTDIAWRRVNHPSEALTIGETVRVQIAKINHETMRISLGMKQLETDPWENVESKFPIGERFTGRVINITDYGAFVELEAGVEGLVHVSEMSWVKKNVHPGKIVSTSQEVEVQVLEIDNEKRRIALSLKQCTENPWHHFAETYPAGTKIKGEVKNITEFGLFIGLENGIDGMVHISDLDWNLSGEEALAKFAKGQEVETVVRDIDIEKERVSLGIKQLVDDPMAGLDKLKRGTVVTCTVNAVKEGGIEVSISEIDAPIFIRRSDLSRDREDQRPDRFEKGEKLDAIVVSIDPKKRHIGLSVKALELAEEKEAVAQYGSSESGASLGDILGAVLTRGSKKKKADKPTDESKTPSPEKSAEKSDTEKEEKPEKQAKTESDSAEKAPAKETKSATKKPAAKKPTAKKPAAKKQADEAESKDKESKDKEDKDKEPSKTESKPKARTAPKTTRKAASKTASKAASKTKEAKPAKEAKTAKKDEKSTAKAEAKPKAKAKTAKTDKKTDSDK